MASAYPASLSAARMKKRASEWDTEGLVAEKDTTETSAHVARSVMKTSRWRTAASGWRTPWVVMSWSHAKALGKAT